MTITNIEYGSLASSEILNNNFSFLEEKITNFNDEINTSISSILSNIATINTRLTEFPEVLANATQESDNKLQEFKSKILIAINKTSLLPDWKNIEIVKILEKEFGVPATLKNDADACAIAEWKWGWVTVGAG